MCQSDDDIRRIAESVVRIDRKVDLIHKSIYGNGDPRLGILYRVSKLEDAFGDVPTWKWVLEKAALPIILSGMGILLGYFLG